jgi:AcrR family transcriptional regulator
MGEKRQQDRIRYNKSNILETAKQLFTEKGIEQTTMADIAKTADYSKSTIYVYFKSKEEIYHHIILEYMITLRNGLEECVEKYTGAIERYYGICNVLMELHDSNPLFFEGLLEKIEVSDEAMANEPVLREIHTVGEEVNMIIETFIQNGITEKVIRSDINIIPTVFVMWASICENIIMAENKKEYFMSRIQMSKKEYLKYSFETLLQSLLIK